MYQVKSLVYPDIRGLNVGEPSIGDSAVVGCSIKDTLGLPVCVTESGTYWHLKKHLHIPKDLLIDLHDPLSAGCMHAALYSPLWN